MSISGSSRTRSSHFTNPFRTSSSSSSGNSTPGTSRSKKGTLSSPSGASGGTVAPPMPGGPDDPNVIVANLSDLPENTICADCGSHDPRHLSVTLGLWLCKECAMLHKDILGVQFSDIRSLDLGLAFWSPDTVKFLQSMGNQKGNRLWEHNHTSSKFKKPNPDSDKATRESWIVAKYQLMDFWKQQREYLTVKVIQSGVAKGAKKVKPTWARRWFTVKWDFIEIFETKEDTEPVERIDLLLATAKEVDPGLLVKDKKVDPACCYQVSTTDKIYVVQCSTYEEFDEWLFTIKVTIQRLRLQLTNQSSDKLPVPKGASTSTSSQSSNTNNSAGMIVGGAFTTAKVTAGSSRVGTSQLGSAAAAATPTTGGEGFSNSVTNLAPIGSSSSPSPPPQQQQPSPSFTIPPTATTSATPSTPPVSHTTPRTLTTTTAGGGSNITPTPPTTTNHSAVRPVGSPSLSTSRSSNNLSAPGTPSGERASFVYTRSGAGLSSLNDETILVRDPKLTSTSLLATLAKNNELKEQQRVTLRQRLDKIDGEYSVHLTNKQRVEQRLAELDKTLHEGTIKQQNMRLRLIQLEPETQMIVSVLRNANPPGEESSGSSAAGGGGLLQKEDGSIQGGTVSKLVQMLTHETYLDPEYLSAFLLTYRSFTTPMDLLEKLKQRFQIQPPPFITAEDTKRFQDTMQKPIRLRVFNVLKHWILHHYYDFSVDLNLTYKLLDFTDEVMEPAGMSQAAEQLRKFLKQKIKGQKKTKQVMIDETRIPKPILPSNWTNLLLSSTSTSNTPSSVAASTGLQFTFGDLDCLEVARQMCILEQGLYKAILPRECLNQAWNHKTLKETAAPNILSIIRRFNRVSAWVAAEVVQKELMPERIKTLERLITVAYHCRELHNFNATQSILAGIAASSVWRMKKTWGGLDPEVLKKYEALKKVMSADSSFATLRAALHSESPPCIPYLGMYLTDLTFIEDGNPDFLQDGMISFAKRRRVAAVIREIQQYQQTPYALQPVPLLLDYVSGLDGMDEKTAYDLSLLVEPREKTVA